MDEKFHRLFDDIVNRLAAEEYDPTENITIQAPPYTPTPKESGPKPLTIQQYLERNQSKKQPPDQLTTPIKKKSKGGIKKRLNREKAELRRLIGLSCGAQKKLFYNKLKDLEITKTIRNGYMEQNQQRNVDSNSRIRSRKQQPENK